MNKLLTTIKMKCIRMCLVQLLIFLSANTVNCALVSPCPRVFEYRFDGVEWYGVISVPSPPYGSSVTLNVQMSIPSALPTSNAGRIELLGPRANVVQAALYGRNIEYNVRFPLPSVIPAITGITLNGNTLCSGPPASGPTITAVNLQHILSGDNRRVNTNIDVPSTSKPASNVQIFEYDLGSNPTEKPSIQIFDQYGNEIKFNVNNNKQPHPSNGVQNQPYPAKTQDSFNNQQNSWLFSNQPNSNNFWNTQNKPYEVNRQPLNPNQNNGQESYPQSKPNQFYSQQYHPNTFNSNQNINNDPIQFPSTQNNNVHNTPNSHNNYNNQFQNQKISDPIIFKPSQPNNNHNPVPATFNQFTERLPQPNNQILTQGVANVVAPVASSQSLKPPTINLQPSLEKPEPSYHGSFQQNYLNMCGLTLVSNPLIANGQTTTKGEFPWLAALFAQKTLGLEFRCSASLISNKHVVTAGHCIRFGDNPALTPSEILIILGKHNIRRWTEKDALISEVERIYIHPNYGSLGFNNDLAVLSLIRTVEFTPFVRPVCMWNESEDLREIIGQFATVVGWGRDEQGHRVTDEPGLAKIPIVSQEDCLRSKVEFSYYTSNRTLCAGLRNGTGPCNGDSGGPLLLHRNDRWFLRGVVSLSLIDPTTRTCDLSQYTVFTDVAKYKDWLLQFFS